MQCRELPLGFLRRQTRASPSIKSGDRVTIDASRASRFSMPKPELHHSPRAEEIHARRPSAARARISSPARSRSRARSPARCSRSASSKSSCARLGLQLDQAACGRAARRFQRRTCSSSRSTRSKGRQLPVGPGSAACAVLRRHGRRAAGGMGPHHALVPRATAAI